MSVGLEGPGGRLEPVWSPFLHNPLPRGSLTKPHRLELVWSIFLHKSFTQRLDCWSEEPSFTNSLQRGFNRGGKWPEGSHLANPLRQGLMTDGSWSSEKASLQIGFGLKAPSFTNPFREALLIGWSWCAAASLAQPLTERLELASLVNRAKARRT